MIGTEKVERPALPPADPFVEWIIQENERFAERRDPKNSVLRKVIWNDLHDEPRRFIGLPCGGVKMERIIGEKVPVVVRRPFPTANDGGANA